jgi:hypothetical protein
MKMLLVRRNRGKMSGENEGCDGAVCSSSVTHECLFLVTVFLNYNNQGILTYLFFTLNTA